VDEGAIVYTLKNSEDVLEKAQKEVDAERKQQAKNRALRRRAGTVAGAVTGGAVIGLTGGLGMVPSPCPKLISAFD
jgi:hypothetical protein